MLWLVLALPALWIGLRWSITPDQYGYGYQWWTPEKPMNDFFAAGIYNQYIYVYPEKDLVIVKLSANHHFRIPGDESKYQHIDFLQAMARAF